MSEVYIRSQNKEKLYRLGGNYACVEYGEYEDIKKKRGGAEADKRALLRGAGRDTESVRKLSVYGWRCSRNKGRHGRTAVCSSNTEAVRNAR
mgnify:CR=1 FL=1